MVLEILILVVGPAGCFIVAVVHTHRQYRRYDHRIVPRRVLRDDTQ